MEIESSEQMKIDVIEKMVLLSNACAASDARDQLRTFSFVWHFGELSVLLRVNRGVIAPPVISPGIEASWDFSMSAPDDVWMAFLQPVPTPPYHHLFAMWARVSAFRLDASREVMVRHAGWLNRLMGYARAAWNYSLEAGVSAGVTAQEQAAPGPAVGKEDIQASYWRMQVKGEQHRIYVEQSGSGPDLLLLHTAGSDARQFYRLMNDERLTSRWRVSAFDLPGHGKSLPPPSWQGKQYRLQEDDYIDYVLAVCDALGLDRPVVLGCSMAGALCLRLAQRHPQRFRGMVACEAAERIPSRLNHWLIHPAIDAGEFAPQWIDGLMAPTTPPTQRQEILWCYSQAAAGIFYGDVAYYSGSFSLSDSEMQGMDTTLCPVYLLTGAYDYSCTPDMSRRTADKIQGAHFQEMHELGHFPIAENPDVFMQYLMPILSALGPYTASAPRAD